MESPPATLEIDVELDRDVLSRVRQFWGTDNSVSFAAEPALIVGGRENEGETDFGP
jgi:hypothetical protein